MGTTLDAMNAGSVRTIRVLAIEGCPYLIAEGLTSAVATAWAARTDWSSVLGGLFCNVEDNQRLHPYEPFGSGGRGVVRIAPDAADTIGKHVARRRGGAETQLTATLDRDDTTATVASTSSFSSSGEIYIGTECIGYSGKTSTTFTGLTRGKYSPIWTAKGTPTRFAHDHRVIVDPNSALIQPVVSALPKMWIGRWAAIYEHRVVDLTLDVLSEAVCVFAGRIADHYDDGKHTCFEIKHALDVIKETSFGRSLFTATVKEGLYLFQNQAFRIRESTNGDLVFENTQTLTVKDSPVGSSQLQSGYYTVESLTQALTDWFARTKASSDIDGIYSIFIGENNTQEKRVVFQWKLTSSPLGVVVLEMPESVMSLFGYSQTLFPGLSGLGGGHRFATLTGASATTFQFLADGPPLRSIVDKFSNFSGGADERGLRFEVEEERGSFVSQFDSIPFELRRSLTTDEGREWGLFLFDEKVLILAAYDSTTHELQRGTPAGVFGSSETLTGAELEKYVVPFEDNPRDITIRQILVMQAPIAAMLQLLFYSTGTLAHNHDTLDNLPFGVGLGIPGGILGDAFEASCNALPGADVPLVVVIDKATTVSDLLGGDLMLRRAFLLWKNGGLQFGSWRTPQIEDAVAVLTESNKAAPAGNEDDMRSVARESDEWVYPVVKIYFDRDLADIQNESFRGIITVEDSTAVDDAGGEGRVLTVKSRNTFADNTGVGATVKDLTANFVATQPMFSRPGRIITRPISPKLYEQLAVGDVVSVTDSSVRDPSTGERGIETVAAIVIGKSIDRGGAAPDSEQGNDPTGTVDLFLPDAVPARTGAAYAPSADVDDTYDTGDYDAGYNATTKTLRCYSYRYSDDGTVISPALADAERFPAGSKVRIIERDPDDSTSPQSWDDVVASQSADDITLTTGLSGFDNTKFYRVLFDDYADATTTQRANTFQADETDALVQDATAAYQYASWPSGTNTYLTNMNSTIGVELPADSTYADGAGRDVGFDQALARLLDMHIDYNSGLSLPVIDNVLTNEDDTGSTWMLLAIRSLELTPEILSNDVWRELSLSPWFRSSDGSSVQLRATLTRTAPGGSSVTDVNRGSIISTATWTTTSTTWDDGTRIEVDCRVKDFTGRAWLLIEATLGCETRGMNRVGEGPRLYENEWWIP